MIASDKIILKYLAAAAGATPAQEVTSLATPSGAKAAAHDANLLNPVLKGQFLIKENSSTAASNPKVYEQRIVQLQRELATWLESQPDEALKTKFSGKLTVGQYDQATIELVKEFQSRYGLDSEAKLIKKGDAGVSDDDLLVIDGVVGPRTSRALRLANQEQELGGVDFDAFKKITNGKWQRRDGAEAGDGAGSGSSTDKQSITLENSLGIKLDAQGKITIIDQNLAKKFLGETIQDGDQLIEVYSFREKYSSVPNKSVAGTNESEILKFISDYKQSGSEFGILVKSADGSENRRVISLSASTIDKKDTNTAKGPVAAKFGFSYESYSNADKDDYGSSSTRVVGVKLTKVEKGSAADKAGLIVGDVITSWGGKPISRQVDLDRLLESTNVKETYSLEVTRSSGKTVILPISSEVTRPKSRGLGIIFERHRDGWLGSNFVNAVHISQVPLDSLGYKLGLRPDMLISGVNGQQINKSTEFTRLLQEAMDKGGDIKLDLMSPYNGVNSIVIPSGTDFYGFIDENKELEKK